MLLRFRLHQHGCNAARRHPLRYASRFILILCLVPFIAATGQRPAPTEVANVPLANGNLFVVADPVDGVIVWVTQGDERDGSGFGTHFDPALLMPWVTTVDSLLAQPRDSGFTTPQLHDLDDGQAFVQKGDSPDSTFTFGITRIRHGTVLRVSMDPSTFTELLVVLRRLTPMAGPTSDSPSGPEALRSRMDATELPERVGGPNLEYPRSLRERGITGSALVMFVIDTTGRVDRNTVQVLETDRREFGRSAQQAIGRSFFKPATVGGRRVPYRMFLRLRFEITR